MLLALVMAATSYTLLSLGFVMQKKGIGWIGSRASRDKSYYHKLAVWTGGFILMNIYALPAAVALKVLPAHIVAAFAGWWIVMLVFFSFFILGERLRKSDYLNSLLVVAGIMVLNLFEGNSLQADAQPEIVSMAFLAGIPPLLLAAGFLRSVAAGEKTWLFALASGCCAGLMVIALRLLVVNHGYRLADYPGSPYLWLYVAAALMSLLALQLALKNGPMIVAGPVQYSATILYPIAVALLAFNRVLHPLQFGAAALIVLGVVGLLRRRPCG